MPGRYLLLPASAQRAILPDEQFCPQSSSSRRILMADRGLGDVQLGGRIGEAQMARRGLKRRNPLRQGSRAVIYPIPRYMSLSHRKANHVLFIIPLAWI